MLRPLLYARRRVSTWERVAEVVVLTLLAVGGAAVAGWVAMAVGGWW